MVLCRRRITHNFYRLQVPLQEGNVSRASVCSWGGGVTSNESWDRSYGRVPMLATSGGDHWRPFQTCSFGEPLPHLRPQLHLAVVTETEAIWFPNPPGTFSKSACGSSRVSADMKVIDDEHLFGSSSSPHSPEGVAAEGFNFLFL